MAVLAGSGLVVAWQSGGGWAGPRALTAYAVLVIGTVLVLADAWMENRRC